jgi:hypothetical protein
MAIKRKSSVQTARQPAIERNGGYPNMYYLRPPLGMGRQAVEWGMPPPTTATLFYRPVASDAERARFAHLGCELLFGRFNLLLSRPDGSGMVPVSESELTICELAARRIKEPERIRHLLNPKRQRGPAPDRDTPAIRQLMFDEHGEVRKGALSRLVEKLAEIFSKGQVRK